MKRPVRFELALPALAALLLLSSCAAPVVVIEGEQALSFLLPDNALLLERPFTAAELRDRDSKRLLLVILNPLDEKGEGGAIEWKVWEKGIRRKPLSQSWNLLLLDRPGGGRGGDLTPELAAEINSSHLFPSLVRDRKGNLRAVVYKVGGIRVRPSFRPDGSLLLEFGRRETERSEVKYSFQLL